ncbi:MAG: hypothetical protein UDD86_07090, partial [Sodaliphilus sp.]|nr:hypothetical protein [Sodaliphilus sp.]
MKYHVPTGFGFSPKASGFYPFDDATDLASEGGGGDVVWMIQASASNHKPKANQRDGSFGMPLAYTNQKLLCLQRKCGLGVEKALSVDARR